MFLFNNLSIQNILFHVSFVLKFNFALNAKISTVYVLWLRRCLIEAMMPIRTYYLTLLI